MKVIKKYEHISRQSSNKNVWKNNLQTPLSLASARRKAYQRSQSILTDISLEQLCIVLLLLSDSLTYSTTDHADLSAMFGKYFLQVFHLPTPSFKQGNMKMFWREALNPKCQFTSSQYHACFNFPQIEMTLMSASQKSFSLWSILLLWQNTVLSQKFTPL